MVKKAKGRYYRKKIRHPVTGEYRDVYAATRTELADKCAELSAAWDRELRDAESPYFFQYAAEWFSRVAGDMTPARREDIAREINRNICPVIGQKRLPEITSDDCLDVLARRDGLGKSARTKTLQALRRILRAAVRAGKIPRDPSADLTPGGEDGAPREALTPAQQEALLSAVAGLPVELFIKIGLFAGLRREEICGLAWRDVHLDGDTPHIDVRQACRWIKNNRPEISQKLKSDAAWRSVPAPPPLAMALAAAKKDVSQGLSEPPGGRTVLAGPEGGPWTYQGFRSAWRAVEARTAGVVKVRRKDPETGKTVTVEVERRLGDTAPRHPGVKITLDFPCTPHILRHTYVTRLILGGVDVRRVQYLAGHESPEVTLKIYTHLMGHRPEDLIDDVSAVFPG